MSERLRTSRLIAYRERPVERYRVAIGLVRIVARDPLVLQVTEQYQLITRMFRARHRLRAELAAQAWLEYRSGILYRPGTAKVDVF